MTGPAIAFTLSNATPPTPAAAPTPSAPTPQSAWPENVHPGMRQQLEHRYHQRNVQSFKAGESIALPIGSLWVVCRGVVTLSTVYDNGEEALLGLVGPSGLFGLPLSQVEPYQAIALSAVDLLSLSMAELEHSPLLCQDLFRSLSHRLRQGERLLAIVGQRRVEDRLRQFLQLLAEEFGQRCTDLNQDVDRDVNWDFSQSSSRNLSSQGQNRDLGQNLSHKSLKESLISRQSFKNSRTPQNPSTSYVRLSVRLTHQHLANALGTTRVTITRLMGQLRREGWLEIDEDRHLLLPVGRGS
ncbi:MAG: Crp/Fnr family transcriptional regulator [Prochlorothrix sp.]